MTAHIVWDRAARDLWSCGGKSPVSKTAARPTDNEWPSVGRTQLSDTGVGDELTVVDQDLVQGATDGTGAMEVTRDLTRPGYHWPVTLIDPVIRIV